MVFVREGIGIYHRPKTRSLTDRKNSYRMSTPELQEMKMKLKELLDLGIIHPSVSPWGVLVIFI
jgi:hypothetical protein